MNSGLAESSEICRRLPTAVCGRRQISRGAMVASKDAKLTLRVFGLQRSPIVNLWLLGNLERSRDPKADGDVRLEGGGFVAHGRAEVA